MAWKTKATKGGGNFEKPPVGNHLARLIGMFDLGIQEQEYGGELKELHRIQWVWELLNEKQAGSSMNHVIGLELTFSLNEKAKMRKLIESRLGKSIADGSEYDIMQELGQSCLLNVVQNGEYTKVDGVSAVPKGMEAPAAQRKPVALTHSEIIAGAEIPDWAPYIYGESPADVASRGKSPDGEESPDSSSSPPPPPPPPAKSGPPPKKTANDKASYWLDFGRDGVKDEFLTVAQIRQRIEAGDVNMTEAKVCPAGGDVWELLTTAIPGSDKWCPF